VQFFDDPVSRAWIKLRDLKDYLGKVRSDVPLLKDAKWNRAIEFADQALKMDKSERWTLIADLKPSDEEDFEANDLEEELTDISPKSITKISNSAVKVSPNSKNINNEPKSELKRKGNSTEKDKNDRKKFKRLVLESSDEDFESESEDDYKPEKSDEESSDDEVQEIIESEEEPMSVEESDSENDSKSKRSSSSKSNNESKSSAKSSYSLFSKNSSDRKSSNSTKPNNNKLSKGRLSLADDSFISVNESVEQNSDKTWPHLRIEFLKPDKIRDKNGRYRLISGELNPDYDSSTLWVPESFLNSQTPAHRQWWVFKSNYFDTVLFFKMGKFYELFHMDAVIAVNELQIIYMKGDCAHAGFPEKAYKRYADVLIQKGYKVARIEQTETPLMMEERCKKLRKTTKFDKVVARELCRVSTIGTRMSSVIDADMMTDGNSYLLALTENVSNS
jgi:DNA mismatch repair protein MSH6